MKRFYAVSNEDAVNAFYTYLRTHAEKSEYVGNDKKRAWNDNHPIYQGDPRRLVLEERDPPFVS